MESTVDRRVYQKLIQVARSGSLISYSEIAPLVTDKINSPRSPVLGKVLRGICSYEVKHGRPMLGSVVVHKTDGHPGKGYFKGAWSLGLFSGGEELIFWKAELEKVYRYWSSH